MVGVVMKVIDAIVLGLLVVIALAVPLFDAQLILPPHLFPEFLIHFKDWLTLQLDHYMLVEKPYFYVGFAWLQLLFNWPLSIAALYSFAAGNTTCFTTTCLPLAVSLFTCLVAILGELLGSGRGSDKLLVFYFAFLSCAVLAILRGLLPVLLYSSGQTTSSAKRLALNQKRKG